MKTFRVWIYCQSSDQTSARLVNAADKSEARTIVNNDLADDFEPSNDYKITKIEQLSK